MWLILLITLINSACDQKGIILKHRLEVGGLPINILDGAFAVALLAAVLGALGGALRFSAERLYRPFIITIVLFCVAAGAGAVIGAAGGVGVYPVINGLRDMLVMPMSMAIAYYFLRWPTSLKWFAHIHVLGGILSAGLIILFFFGKALDTSATRSLENIRAIQYVSSYAGLGAVLLLYMLALPAVRLYPKLLVFLLAGFCLVGQFGTLSRSDWLSVLGAMAVFPFCSSGSERWRLMRRLTIALPLVLLSLVFAVILLSHLTEREVGSVMTRRFETMLPTARGDEKQSGSKAWDTRLPGILYELNQWMNSPLIGQGFGYGSKTTVGSEDVALSHNVWSSTLASTGIIGFSAYALAVIGIFVIGKRMIRDRVSRDYVIIGIIGLTAGAFFLIIGACTMSFNQQRMAIDLGLIVGAVFRARSMQLTEQRQIEFGGYEDEWGDPASQSYDQHELNLPQDVGGFPAYGQQY